MKKFNKNLIVFVLAIALMLGFTGPNVVYAATSPTLVGSTSYSVLGGAAVTNTGTTTMDGAVGVSPGASIGGGITAGGGIHSNDASAIAAQADLTTATTGVWDVLDAGANADANCLNGVGGTGILPDATDLATLGSTPGTLPSGLYCSAGSFLLTNARAGSDLILTGAGPWVFKTVSTLITSSASSVTVATGSACDVWWRVGSAATLGSTTAFIGNIITANVADVSTMVTGATLNGRLLAQAAATVALQGNTITAPICTAPPAPVVRRSSGSIPRAVVPVFQPTINILSTPVVVAPIIPRLPKTGFAPQESGIWYQSLLNNILNLFR